MATPSRAQVKKAVEQSGDSRGKVLKVLFLDDEGKSVGDWASSQIPEDPFRGTSQAGLVEPPFPLAQLVYLAEMHPVHSAALEQKTVDVCGKGWEWKALNDDTVDPQETFKDELDKWFNGLAPEEFDMKEVLQSVWLDVETVGWGLLELARDNSGIVQRVYHVPGHTVRAHKDGFRLCQIRDERKVWFRRWGAPQVDGAEITVDMKTGSKTTINTPANDLFVIRKPSRRSTWYGIPGYVSAIGWITLALAARDDNLFFFANRREPRWAIVLSNLHDNDDIEEQLRRAFTVDLRQPHRNIIVPISGPGKVDFQKLSDNRQEGSFSLLSERADAAITVAHRVPAERIANASVGPLGGNIAVEASRIYKDGVVGPSQELFNNRLNRFAAVEYAKATSKNPESFEPTHKLALDSLDIDSDREELSQTVIAFHGNLTKLREARHRLGLGPLMVPSDPENPNSTEIESPLNDKLFTELPGSSGAAGQPGTAPPGADSLRPGPSQPKFGARGDDHLDAVSRQLLRSARDLEARIEVLSEAEPVQVSVQELAEAVAGQLRK